PNTKRPSAVRPCEPTTIRSGFHLSAFATSSHAGEPHEESAVTFQFGNLVCTRSDARWAKSSASLAAGQCFVKSRCNSAGECAFRASSMISRLDGGGGGSHTSAIDMM